jgi:hypothetical protein
MTPVPPVNERIYEVVLISGLYLFAAGVFSKIPLCVVIGTGIVCLDIFVLDDFLRERFGAKI